MLHNFKVALRSLRGHVLYTWINIIGLAISLTTAILIMLWVQDEWRYDRFYERIDDIYIVVNHSFENGNEDYSEYLPVPLARAAKAEIAEVEAACAVGFDWSLSYIEYNEQKYVGEDEDYALVDTSFFNVFSMEFIEGDKQNAFADANAIVLTDEIAQVIFGQETALGKTIKDNRGKEYHVSAVVRQSPQNSMLQFKVIRSFEQSGRKNSWRQYSCYNFLLLNSEADPKIVAGKLTEAHKKYSSDYLADFPYILQPLSKKHLYAADGSETGMKNVRMFTLTAIALLVIACINYVNIVTARARRRSKEISLHRIVGAGKLQLFVQIISETVLTVFISIILTTVLLYLLMPYYNVLTGKELVFNVLSPTIGLLYLAAFVLIVLLAGVYPAVFLSSIKPSAIFKQQQTERRQVFIFRKLLVIMQFTCSAGLILITITMNRQQLFMQTRGLGYEREDIFAINVFTNKSIGSHFEAFKQELQQQASIAGVAASEQNVLNNGNFSDISWEGKLNDDTFSGAVMGIDRDFIPLLNFQLVEGNGFNGTAADSAHIIVNETAVKQMGLNNPLNTTIEIKGWGIKGKIAGVAKDFNFRHMSEPISPMFMYLRQRYWTIYIKAADGKTAEALAVTGQIWKKYDAEYPFTYKFMDETFDKMYHKDRRASRLFSVFAIVAVLVSCMGLFGLAAYTAEVKTKEIGIRKTLGASVGSIVNMLLKEFIVLVTIALFVALPLAGLLLQRMLQDYAYRISFSWWLPALAAGITLTVTLLTVSGLAIKAATENPVKAIKAE